jgi:hypothetical protein
VNNLTAGQVDRLTSLITDRLRTSDLSPPFEDESEPAYTTRELRRPMREVLEELGIPGLATAGGGAGQIRPVYMLGLHFYPDLIVTFRRSPIVAVEVKYLKRGQRQNSLATAVGQATVYRQWGYRRAIVVLIDLANRLVDEEVAEAQHEFMSTGFLELVIRRVVGTVVQPDRFVSD